MRLLIVSLMSTVNPGSCLPWCHSTWNSGMTVYVTFYSFKGGVGRTLALANVATLLATRGEEPCRVLVWDFDLGAPGLQQVLKCRWQAGRQGFVDYVHHYLVHAQMDQIEKYIHPTDVEGVHILPAGAMDHAYATKLE